MSTLASRTRLNAYRAEIGVAYFRDYPDGQRIFVVMVDAQEHHLRKSEYEISIRLQFIVGGSGSIGVDAHQFDEHYHRVIPRCD